MGHEGYDVGRPQVRGQASRCGWRGVWLLQAGGSYDASTFVSWFPIPDQTAFSGGTITVTQTSKVMREVSTEPPSKAHAVWFHALDGLPHILASIEAQIDAPRWWISLRSGKGELAA